MQSLTRLFLLLNAPRGVNTFAILLPTTLLKGPFLWTLFSHKQAPTVLHSSSSSSSSTTATTTTTTQVLEEIGSGSYGTVHLLDNGCIGKRAWTVSDLERLGPECVSQQQLHDKAQRCLQYWKIEQYCFEFMKSHPSLPIYRGVLGEQEHHQWLMWDKVLGVDVQIAPSLQDLLEREREHPSSETLEHVAVALGLETTSTTTLTDVLDPIISDLLQALQHIHAQGIVHRDIKPSNLLVRPTSLSSSLSSIVLIDFGSAAHVTTAGWFGKNIGISNEVVAVSPIYTAPELFIDPSIPSAALKFDVFSAALLICQLLFHLTDERADAGFHQQVAATQWNLDDWLQTQLQGKITPNGLLAGLQVLQDRPGLWTLLQGMLVADPTERLSSADAWTEWQRVVRQGKGNDSPFLEAVLESLDVCPVPPLTRPLHFVATFRRSVPLGLVLSEVDGDDNDFDSDETRRLWQHATADALPGQVFVKEVVKGGQAEEMGIFEIGDHLQGIGELALAEGGFERAIAMLQQQPQSAKYVTLHFDRKSVASDSTGRVPMAALEAPIQVICQGAWSSRGRRKAQEDAFVLHEIHDTNQSRFLLAGVMDGHLGTAASTFVQEKLPESFSTELIRSSGSRPIAEEALERSWNDICDTYRAQCDSDACAAEYDPREGILLANTGAADVAAGTTCCVLALNMQTSDLAVLNCGDSRAVVVDAGGKVGFQSCDHTPEAELQRFEEAILQGFDYCQPECRLSRWILPVGGWNSRVSRSLEGAFATQKGIVSTPDLTTLQVKPGMTAVVATDGLWEVIDTNEVAHILHRVRYAQDMSAADAAKTLCSMALDRGSSDNVSVTILYLD